MAPAESRVTFIVTCTAPRAPASPLVMAGTSLAGLSSAPNTSGAVADGDVGLLSSPHPAASSEPASNSIPQRFIPPPY
jgi:hypothetical protein